MERNPKEARHKLPDGGTWGYIIKINLSGQTSTAWHQAYRTFLSDGIFQGLNYLPGV